MQERENGLIDDGYLIRNAVIKNAKIWVSRGIMHMMMDIVDSEDKVYHMTFDNCYDCVHHIMQTLRGIMVKDLIGKEIRIAVNPYWKSSIDYLGHCVLDMWCSLK